MPAPESAAGRAVPVNAAADSAPEPESAAARVSLVIPAAAVKVPVPVSAAARIVGVVFTLSTIIVPGVGTVP